MADEPQQIRGINWRETFPFTHLFRAFRIAVHPSKLMLGLIALLALYGGGRALDGLWSPRHLAVPSEVYLYERTIDSGGTSAQFAERRKAGRQEMEEEYARRLIELGVETDPARAREAAREAKRLGDVKDKILLRRQEARNRVEQEYSTALANAKNITDAKERERLEEAAEQARDVALRGIYSQAYEDLREAKKIRGVGLFHAFFDYEAERVNGVVEAVINGNWIGRGDGIGRGSVVENVKNFFVVGPMWLMRHHPFYFVLFTLLFLTIWAIFGGAIARIAAVHVARDEKLSVRAALAFSLGKFLSFVSAPLIPLVIVLIVGLVPLIAGALASIPGLGPIFNILMGALFVLILAAGFVMTLVLLGTFGGFNLMYPTIAVEGSDSFDAISRSFSYVYARPWRMLLYTLVAIIYGALCYLFVRLFIWMLLSLTHHFVGAGMWAEAPSTDPLWSTMWRGPSAPPGRLSYDVDFLTLRWDQDIAAGLVAFWVYLAVGMLGAFAISFYFTANTIIYYLMRHEVDATELDDVYLEQSEEDFADATAPPASASASPVVAATSGSGGGGGGTSTSVASTSDEPSSLASPDKADPPTT
ncbi:MAG: hypothetical protein QOE14_1502 [Humisphaera sp.]|nr:hypothetical protein [Humisphaera sp.]